MEGAGEIRSKANFAGEVPGETRKCRSKYGIRLLEERNGADEEKGRVKEDKGWFLIGLIELMVGKFTGSTEGREAGKKGKTLRMLAEGKSFSLYYLFFVLFEPC